MPITEVEIVPPGFDGSNEDGGEEDYLSVHIFLAEPDGTRRGGFAGILPGASDEEFADAIVECLRSVVATRGPGLEAAVERRLRPVSP